MVNESYIGGKHLDVDQAISSNWLEVGGIDSGGECVVTVDHNSIEEESSIEDCFHSVGHIFLVEVTDGTGVKQTSVAGVLSTPEPCGSIRQGTQPSINYAQQQVCHIQPIPNGSDVASGLKPIGWNVSGEQPCWLQYFD